MRKACIWVALISIIIIVMCEMIERKRGSKEVMPADEQMDRLEQVDQIEQIVSDDFAKAHQLLAKTPAGYRLDGTGKKVIQHNVLLAIKRPEYKDVELITLFDGVRPTKGFKVRILRQNGVNTQYEVVYPTGYAVLALKRVVRADNIFKEVTYTPYTHGIDTKELRWAGLEYLKNKLDQAQADLHDKNIKSLAYGGRVADAIPKDVALTLAIIEHIDPSRFNAGVSMKHLVSEVLIVLAANRENAHRYSVSKVGARGQFQFMQKTYESIDKRYPKAQLIDNFGEGMDNHVNAAKASLLLFDSDLSYLAKPHRTFLKKYPEAMGMYLAAAYNGGPKRALDSIHRYGKAWESHVAPETRMYLKEYKAVWGILHN